MLIAIPEDLVGMWFSKPYDNAISSSLDSTYDNYKQCFSDVRHVYGWHHWHVAFVLFLK